MIAAVAKFHKKNIFSFCKMIILLDIDGHRVTSIKIFCMFCHARNVSISLSFKEFFNRHNCTIYYYSSYHGSMKMFLMIIYLILDN